MPATIILRRFFLAIVVVSAAVSSAWWAPPVYHKYSGATTRPASATPSKIDTWVVKRDKLRITFNETGKLRAIKSYPIYPEIIREQLKITFLATEGASVKKGDLLVSFDTKALKDQLDTHKADYDTALRTRTVNKSALEIAKSTGETGVKQAQIKLDDAKVAYKTYVELEGPKKLNELDTAINESKGKLTTGQKAVTDVQTKMDEGLFSDEDQKQALEKEQADAKESSRTLQKSVDALILQRKIFRTYEYPQSIKSKKQAVESAQMDVEKAKVSGENDVASKDAELAKSDDTIRRLKHEIDDLQDQIKKCDLYAPAAGLVVYGDTSNPYRGYNGQEIKVGAEWYGGQTVMTIPDLSAFEIDLRIAEDYVGKVKEGMPVNLTFDAVPDVHLKGKLKEIAKLGQNREYYDPSSPRVFNTAVTVDGHDPRLVSGMTARVEIVADEADGLLTVPSDALATESGKTIVMLRTASGGLDRREVKTGRSNNDFVEITQGLSEGDRVALGAQAEAPTAK